MARSSSGPEPQAPGRLYVVATPIGNLEDITLRALRVLREVDLVAAEDTRVTRKLLNHYEIATPSTSYHQHSGGAKTRAIVEELLAGKSVALVSDAGMPGVSDPGHELIRDAVAAGVSVIPIPGATAAISALAVSGLPTARFAFDAFPPRSRGERLAFFSRLRAEPRTVVLYESPRRLTATLESIREALGERQVAVARELTKLFEEVVRGTVSEVLAHYTERKPVGECVIVLEGAGPGETAEEAEQPASVEVVLRDLMARGLSERDAVRQAASQLRRPRREIYAVALAMKEEEAGPEG